jgi:hypothetical protein
MTDIATPKPQPADIGGIPWFTLMVGLWSAFSTLLITSPETLGDIWRWLTGLPLALEILMWIAILPWALALAVWQSSWAEWLQLLVIALLGLFWTSISAPRART